ncbi:septum formation initiator family protein [Patescibacteria group bacterium]|nr:septum formation initiator family protein [Patescibacteria group bacterium]
MSKRYDFWSIVTSRIFLLVALVAIVIIGVGITKSLLRRAELQKEINQLESDTAVLENKNSELGKLIDYLATEEFKEREARLRLGLQKPGETVVVIPSLTNTNSQTNLTNQQSTAELSNWQRWLNYFFKK